MPPTPLLCLFVSSEYVFFFFLIWSLLLTTAILYVYVSLFFPFLPASLFFDSSPFLFFRPSPHSFFFDPPPILFFPTLSLPTFFPTLSLPLLFPTLLPLSFLPTLPLLSPYVFTGILDQCYFLEVSRFFFRLMYIFFFVYMKCLWPRQSRGGSRSPDRTIMMCWYRRVSKPHKKRYPAKFAKTKKFRQSRTFKRVIFKVQNDL